MSASETSGVTTQGASFVATSVNHPRLVRTDPDSIRIFLRLYDQYEREVTARAAQVTGADAATTEAVRPVSLKFCVDPEFLESAIALDLIPDASSYNDLTDTVLRKHLEAEAIDSKEALSLDALDEIVNRELRMDMANPNSRSRMQTLFVSYHKLLRRHGISWVLDDNEKVAVSHVLSAIRPKSLQDRLKSDLEFARTDCRKDFTKFMKHAVKLADAFQLLDNGPKHGKTKVSRTDGKPGRGGSSSKPTSTPASTSRSDGKRRSHLEKSKGSLPDCPFHACSATGEKHLIKNCPKASSEEKSKMLDELRSSKYRDGPSRSTRSQTGRSSASSEASKPQPKSGGTVARMGSKPPQLVTEPPSCSITVSDGISSQETTGRCDDGSDESIVSSRLAEKAVVQGIGRMTAIKTIKLRVALKNGEDEHSFSFSRSWTCPRTVMHLASGQLALTNVTFLVADAELACEPLIIGLPVIQHLQVDTRTLLENNRDVLDGADCSHIRNTANDSRGGTVSRMMISRLNGERTSDNDQAKATDIDMDRPRVNYNTARMEEDPFPDPSLLDPIDSDQHADVRDSVEEMKKTADENGLPKEIRQPLSEILDEHLDVFRTAFSAGPPARLRPLKIDLTPDAVPVKVRLRNYSQDQRDFLKKFVSNLVYNDMAYPNPTSSWACAPLLVPKPGSDVRYRFTVDLRPVNKFTVKHQFPMPNLEHELTRLSESRYYATFDLSHCYWQLELDESSRSLQSFITPDGVYSPTRVLHGTTNAVTHLQSALSEILPTSLSSHFLHWLDDILLHDRTVPGLIKSIRNLFGLCVQYNIKLHPAKSIMFAKSIRWCGRVISADGIRYDPRRLDGLLNIESPKTGAHLQQFICALQWIKNGIPNFASIVTPLHQFMEQIYTKAGKRTKQAVARYKLSAVGWGPAEDNAFAACKTALANQVTLSHRDETKRLCWFPDACDSVWSAIITQVPFKDLTKPHVEQDHEPLAFLSGRFSATQLGWSILEKEAYAAVASLERMHWLAATPAGFDLYTDHNNLIFLFDPLSVVPDLSQTSLRKVLRWAVRLSMYNYTCFHIRGADNVWADLLGRWAAPTTIRRIVRIPELPSSSTEGFEWPTAPSIISAQESAAEERPPNLCREENIWKNPSGAIWIPDSSSDLQLRLCIIAHTGASGHRGAGSTEKVLRKYYFWSTMTTDIRSFVRACIHCLSTTGGGKIPRPYGPAVHGTNPNDLLQFDYFDIGPSRTGEKYVLLLRDDATDYKWMFAFPDTSAENAATAIIDWSAAFGVPKGLMSDGPTHFRNETLRLIAKGLKTTHHFTLPYSPWSNGAVERLGKEMLRVFRSIVSEFQMSLDEWPDLLPVVQSALNNAPSPSRGNISPITAFVGKEPTPPIATFLRTDSVKPITVTDAQRERLINVQALKDRVAELHPLVAESVRKNRQRSREAASAGTLPNFSEGDYVLVAREEFSAGEKLCLRWRGPRRVVKAQNDYVFQVEDLRNGAVEDIHGTRLKFYRDADLDTRAIMSHVLSSETGMPVARLMRLEETDDRTLKVVVRWKGLPHSEDTLEPLHRVYEDVPRMLLRLLQRKSTPQRLAEKARRALAL